MDYGVRLFLRNWAGCLVTVRRTFNGSACQSILDSAKLSTFWEQFEDDPFLFQHDCAAEHKSMSIKTWMGTFAVEELAFTEL